ncbi:MAG: CsbD family protein [Pseudomonadota bacterium]
MNWDRIEGNWKQLKGRVKSQWGRLTDDDFDVVAGQREQMAGKLQERYGIARDEAERQIQEWEGGYTDQWLEQDERSPRL